MTTANHIVLPAPTQALARATLDIDNDVDPLTGLLARRHLLAALAESFARKGPSPALLLLDLDRFKALNDSLGHLIGDLALRRVAQRLCGVAGRGALVARISGDGFAILLRNGEDARDTAARLLDLLGRPYAIAGHAVTLGSSIGVAIAPQDGTDADSLLNAADLALHQAEADGRNRLCQFEPTMQARAKLRRALENDLRSALVLQQGELRKAVALDHMSLHYQPQVNLATRELTGFEALMRWNHPQRGLVSPSDFIPLAEEIGLISLLGGWALRTACRDAASWPGLKVGVNVSPLQLRDGPLLVQSVAQALAESRLPPWLLEIEITESALMGDAAETINALHDMGVKLALDDFGTGFSSLSQLGRFSFDRIKIDRSFVADLDKPPNPDAGIKSTGMTANGGWMISAIAALGTGLGMSTIAEGVETEAQAAIVRAAGCDEMQGFLVSRAVPLAEVAPLIARLRHPPAQPCTRS